MNNEFKGLRHYIDIVESAQTTNEGPVADATGQLLGAIGGSAKNAVTGAYDAVKSGVSGAVDAAGNAINSVVQPVVQGAQAIGQGMQKGYAATQGQPAPQQNAAAKTQPKPQTQGANPTKPTAPAKPAGGAPAGFDANVKALQDKLIAAGAKIKADGIMGPQTRAAQAQFPNVTTQTDAEKAHAASLGDAPAQTQAANPTPAAAAPAGVQAVGDDEGNTTITRPDGSTMVVGPDGKPYIPGSNPNLPQNQDKRSAYEKIAPNFMGGKSAPVVPNAQTTSPWQTAQGQSQPAAESVTYKEDQSLARIISLANYSNK